MRSLAYRTPESVPAESKKGYVYFDANPKDYYYWDFKIELKAQVASGNQKDWNEMILALMESLRGDALEIATQIGGSA